MNQNKSAFYLHLLKYKINNHEFLKREINMSNLQRKSPNNLFQSINQAIAYYDPSNFTITFNTISENEFKKLEGNPTSIYENIENIKTFYHELRHNIDHISTLWGHKNMLKHLRSLNSHLENNYKGFKSIIDYKLEENQLFYVKYFTVIYNNNKAVRPWSYLRTTGVRFDSNGNPDETKPIPLIQFSSFDKKPLVRIPLSIASLLETNAIYEEIKIHLVYLETLDSFEKIIKTKEFESYIFNNLIYNQQLAVYNVAVHLTSNILGLSNILDAINISSSIATLTLNLPSKLVQNLYLNPKYLESWGDRCNQMLKNNEYGFIFMVLLENYSIKYMENNKFNVNDLLSSSNLPSYDEIYSIIELELDNIENELNSFKNFKSVFQTKMKTGRSLLKRMGLCNEKRIIQEAVIQEKFSPIIICNDTNWNDKGFKMEEIAKMQPIENINPIDWYFISWEFDKKFNDFFEVRGI